MSSSPGSNLTAGSSRQHTPPAVSATKHKKQFLAELNVQLYEFVVRLLPTPDEMAIKEDVRKLLEKLIRTIEPESTLLAFGSTANGFSLRNSDMDLCCLMDSGRPSLNATDLVTMVGDLLERETKFTVKTLPHARIPIVKLSLSPSPGLPSGIACDIGFENRLALENTRMLHTYACFDPARVRTIVLFLKVWCKRRKVNSPYEGTLSSYGYVLLVIYFLVHVKSPPVLPNLQQGDGRRMLNGHNVWFHDDVEHLRQRWQSSNTQNVAELLVDFFKYYSRDFPYNMGVASIRAGPLKKSDKGWTTDYTNRRDGNRLCIEDPFETDFNVGRCVTKEGLYLIRGEFMRAARILAGRPESSLVAIAQLCAERDDTPLVTSPMNAHIPPAPPYAVGAARPSVLPLLHIAPARSPSVSDADDFADFDPDGEDDASVASAPPRRVASTSGSGFGPERGRPVLQPHPHPPPVQLRPQAWTRHPPGFISHHPRRSASAGAAPRHSFMFTKPGEPSNMPAPAVPTPPLASNLRYQPQFAELQHQRRRRSPTSDDSAEDDDTTPRGATFRASGVAVTIPGFSLGPAAHHLAEEMARLRVQEDRTPRARVQPDPPPRIEISCAEPASVQPVKAR